MQDWEDVVCAGLGGCGVCREASAELLEDSSHCFVLRMHLAFVSLELPRKLMAGLMAQVMFKVGKWASLSHERFYHSFFVFAQFSLSGTFGRESQRAVLHTLCLMD